MPVTSAWTLMISLWPGEQRRAERCIQSCHIQYKLNLMLLNYIIWPSKADNCRSGQACITYSTDITTKLKDAELHENHKKLLHSVNAKSTKP